MFRNHFQNFQLNYAHFRAESRNFRHELHKLIRFELVKIREIRVKEQFIFLHFARKTFNPWAWIQN